MEELEHLKKLIEQHGDHLIVKNDSVVGVCECKGKGKYVHFTVGNFGREVHGECDGRGCVTEWTGQEPCGRSEYDYHTCPCLKKAKVLDQMEFLI